MSELEPVGRGAELAVLGARAGPDGRRPRHAGARGRRVGVESDMPFRLFLDALDEYVRDLPPARLAALDDDVHAELGHALPSPRRPARGSRR